MEKYVGKICPYCKTKIREGEAVIVCPACGIPHHASCWTENKGCTTFGCSQQHYEAQGTNPTSICPNCGTPLGDGQAFCPNCGTPKNSAKKNICSNCGAELKPGQQFCSKCGHKAGQTFDDNVNSAIKKFNAGVKKTNAKKKNKPILIAIVVASVLLIFTIGFTVVATLHVKKDFNDMFAEYEDESWCYISDDGSYMTVDTNRWDIEDRFDSDAYYAIEEINAELGFSAAVMSKMGETSALDGRQTESNDDYTVSWKYHPDSGLEVTYEINN